MINRNNKYVSTDKKQIQLLTELKKRVLVAASGALVTITLLTGCGKTNTTESISSMTSNQSFVAIEYESMEEIDISSFEQSIHTIDISFTDLEDISELEQYTNLNVAILSDNLITDVSPLETLPKLKMLDISNNSVSSINVEAFEELNNLKVDGNYNLYTENLINYCAEHDIKLDITMEDVRNVDRLKVILSTLNLEGKTDLEKEKIISDYIINHMEYDDKALKDETLAMEYNTNALAYGIEGKGVCATYATMFDAMCELEGINCYVLTGYGKTGTFSGGSHAWNMVNINGEYMLCDVTWCDNNMPFGLGDEAYLNKTGEKAEEFIEEHIENNSEGIPEIQFNIRSDKFILSII